VTARSTCRVLSRFGDRCTGEPLDTTPGAEVVICASHAAAVMRLIHDQVEKAGLKLGLSRSA